MVSKASDDFPEPDGPVKMISWFLGRRTSTRRRLCSAAPRTSMYSCRGGIAGTGVCSVPRAAASRGGESRKHESSKPRKGKVGESRKHESSKVRNEQSLCSCFGLSRFRAFVISWLANDYRVDLGILGS